MDDHHYSLEIERKFRVASDAWKESVTGQVRLVDGLIAETDGRKVRVRTRDGRATLTIKGARAGLAREEFEYEIPYDHAVRLLESHCGDRRIEKERFLVPYSGVVWEIDVYGGIMNGIVIAEVELPAPDFVLSLPEWVGEEVTGKDEYRKINMLKARLAQRKVRGC